MKKSHITNGVTLYYIEDGKYKTNYLNIYFSLPLTAENATYMNLLARVLKRGSESFPTIADLNRALDMNYAASVTLTAVKEGEKEVFLLSLSTLKNVFAPNGEDIFGESAKVLFDLVKNPLTQNGTFKRDYFESEKKNLHDSILSQINNKASYARTRFVSTMCEGEAYAVNGEGDLSLLDTITPESLYAFLNKLLATAVCDIYFVGSESEEKIKGTVETLFEGLERQPVVISKSKAKPEVSEKKDKTEKMDITQGHLFIGFRTPVTYSHPDYLKFVLFNMVLGGDVSSKMFMNIREKKSLCYTCYSSLDGTKGILFAYAGIDPEKKDETLSAFFTELENIRCGKVSEGELEDAKKAYINRMREIEDNPALLAPWYHLRLERDAETPPSFDAERIAALTTHDVVYAAKSIEEDTIYFLRK